MAIEISYTVREPKVLIGGANYDTLTEAQEALAYHQGNGDWLSHAIFEKSVDLVADPVLGADWAFQTAPATYTQIST